MFLYNLRLEAPTAIVQAVIGSFMGSRQQQEIVVSRGDQIEMYQTTEKLNSILVQQVFGVIRALLPFRLTGGNKGSSSLFPMSELKLGLAWGDRLPGYLLGFWENRFS